ncbi:MAG: isopentenyl-diphosphate Delta-isomerase [Hyphomicrobiaceae bacterium]
MTSVDPTLQDPIPAWVDGRLVPAAKLEVHRSGLRHKAVSVFVVVGDELLIQRRALGKYHTPGLWANTCCTHPRWGEAATECARRRLDEELGLVGLPLTWRDRIEYRAEVGDGMVEHEVVDLFLSMPANRPEPLPDPAEVMETAWIPLDELCALIARHPRRFTPWLRIYLRDHKPRIFGAASGRGAP